MLFLMITKRKKQNVIKEVGMHEKDTGSAEVQVGILSRRIDELTKHLKTHKKDIHSRRGLLGMVADRQTHLRYLQKKHPKRYTSVIRKLELKK
ncbi:MAG: small subunit ribosomal protein S15 [Parcubacteria group bacterium Gr01-1014_17]|nr:MAG: small subunit ribosomal protein S15 [Parcubacteria group bacterium Gr01-1014_17]